MTMEESDTSYIHHDSHDEELGQAVIYDDMFGYVTMYYQNIEIYNWNKTHILYLCK